MPLSRNLGTLTSWNPLGHSRSVKGLILPLPFTHTIILPFSSSYIRTRNSLRLRMIYVSSFFLGIDLGTTNNKGWYAALINTKRKKEMPLNSFDQNMIRNANLETKNTQHYITKHIPKQQKKWCEKSDFANWGPCQHFPYKQQKLPHGNIFISRTEALEICSPVKRRRKKKRIPATPYSLAQARLNVAEPCSALRMKSFARKTPIFVKNPTTQYLLL